MEWNNRMIVKDIKILTVNGRKSRHSEEERNALTVAKCLKTLNF